MEWLNEYILSVLETLGWSGDNKGWIGYVIAIIIVVAISWLSGLLCSKVIVPVVRKLTNHTNAKWDDIVFSNKQLRNLCSIVPAVVAYLLVPFALEGKPFLLSVVSKLAEIYIIATSLRIATGFISALYELSERRNVERKSPLKGVFQMLQVIIIFLGVILIFSVVIGKSPFDLFVGLGAAATVLMLVFKDSIMGLVSGIQLSANDMLRPGDWISMPKHGVDGMVFEVNLTTVKVRNWDKTISTVPPYTLVCEAFVNWRGMFESGGRRVKRHLNIDMSSVKFLNDKELKAYKADNLVSDADNPEELTNFTMFRRYMLRYLQNNPRVNSEMTLLVRHLQPSEHGIPIEFYFFSADTAWAAYETLQADVFDFAIAKAHEFGLKIFQNISGCLNS